MSVYIVRTAGSLWVMKRMEELRKREMYVNGGEGSLFRRGGYEARVVGRVSGVSKKAKGEVGCCWEVR